MLRNCRRRRSACGLAIALLAAAGLSGIALAAQSELVIHKEGTPLYHRPGCPVIRDGAGVLAMTRAQAQRRGLKPHPDCDPATAGGDSSDAAPPGGGRSAAAVTVYVESGKYYHRKGCAKLKGSGSAAEPKPLDIAGKTHWPCPSCRPPVRRKGTGPAVPGTGRRGR